MNNEKLEQLSRDVAEKYGIDATETEYWVQSSETWHNDVWLHDDIGRCATLAIEHEIDIEFFKNCRAVMCLPNNLGAIVKEKFADHNGNKVRATCVAILKALKDKP